VSRRGWTPLATISAGLLLWGNVVVPRLPAGAGGRTAANVGATAVLLAGTRPMRLSADEVGLGRRTWRSGVRAGSVALAGVTGCYALALTSPRVRARLAAADGDALSGRRLAVRAGLLSPIGTVLCEELAFRGVLHAAAARRLSPWRALALTSAVFGLWHLDHARLAREGGASGGPASGGPATGGTAVLLVTVGGGLALGWLRHRTGSLLAPAGLHLATNSVGLAASAAASAWVGRSRRLGRSQPSPVRGWGMPASRARTSDSR
jgi:uncharacterized protein